MEQVEIIDTFETYQRLVEDGIRFSPPSPCFGDASTIVVGRVEVCLLLMCLRWICSDLYIVCLCLCVFRLDPFDIHYSLEVVIDVLVCWSYGALTRRLFDRLWQQILPGSSGGEAVTVARLGLALVLVVVAIWSMNLDVIFVISDVHCTIMFKDE